MLRFACSLFHRRGEKSKNGDVSQEHGPYHHHHSTTQRVPYLSGNSSTSSSTSFSLRTPEDPAGSDRTLDGTDSTTTPNGKKRWNSVFRKKAHSSPAPASPSPPVLQASRPPPAVPRQPPPRIASKRPDRTPFRYLLNEENDILSPPIRPFVQTPESSRSSSSSPRSSRSSLIPSSTPQSILRAIILNSLHQPVPATHPLLHNPIFNTLLVYPRSVSPLESSRDPSAYPPAPSLHRHLLRMQLLKRLEVYPLSPYEERSIASRVASPAPSYVSAQNSQARALRLQPNIPSEVEAMYKVDAGGGWSRGLNRWAERPGFEERNLIYLPADATYQQPFVPNTSLDVVVRPITGGPIASLEFSDGLEALAGLRGDLLEVQAQASPSSVFPRELPPFTSTSQQTPSFPSAGPAASLNLNFDDLDFHLTVPSSQQYLIDSSSPSISAFSPRSTASTAAASASTPRNSSPIPPPSALRSSSPSLSTHGRSSSLGQTPADGRSSPLPKRGVRFAPSVPSSSISSASVKTTSPPPNSRERRDSNPVFIVHPSTAAERLEIEGDAETTRRKAMRSSRLGVPPKRTSLGLDTSHGPASMEVLREDRGREMERQREMMERERKLEAAARRKKKEEKRLQDEVVAARLRRESFKADGGSTSLRALMEFEQSMAEPFDEIGGVIGGALSPSLGAASRRPRSSRAFTDRTSSSSSIHSVPGGGEGRLSWNSTSTSTSALPPLPPSPMESNISQQQPPSLNGSHRRGQRASVVSHTSSRLGASPTSAVNASSPLSSPHNAYYSSSTRPSASASVSGRKKAASSDDVRSTASVGGRRGSNALPVHGHGHGHGPSSYSSSSKPGAGTGTRVVAGASVQPPPLPALGGLERQMRAMSAPAMNVGGPPLLYPVGGSGGMSVGAVAVPMMVMQPVYFVSPGGGNGGGMATTGGGFPWGGEWNGPHGTSTSRGRRV